jgi:hypothetical protein
MLMIARTALIIGYTLFFFQGEKSYGQSPFQNPDSLVHHLYDVLSGPAGEHDWGMFRSLFHEKAIMGALSKDAQGHETFRCITPAEYIERNGEFFRTRGFQVRETHRTTERFGGVMHLFSTYEFRVDSEGIEQQKGRGINSFQLIHYENRWWIISIQYTNERPDLPIPKSFGG